MLFARYIISFFAVGAVSVLASPSRLEARQDVTDVLNIVNDLKTTVETVTPQLDELVNSGKADKANVRPLLEQLTAAFDLSAVSLDAIGRLDGVDDLVNRQVAETIAIVYSTVGVSLNNLQTKAPRLFGLLAKVGLDRAMNKVLFNLVSVLSGVLALIGSLLTGVGGILSGLGVPLLPTLLGIARFN